jgi:hypothetical protein
MTVGHRENLKICTDCGEIFDANIEVEAVHHSQADHAPLLPARKQRLRPTRKVARAA